MNDLMPVRLPIVESSENEFSDTKFNGRDLISSKETLKEVENPDEGIRNLLATYDIGAKLRQLRLRKKIALVDLGKHTSLSASMLSQLENGKLIPTLPTLTRIAMVFDVGLEYFFTDKSTRRVFSIVRAGERMRFPDLADSPTPGYFFEVLAFGATEKSMSAYLAEFPKREANEVRHHVHAGAEFIHVLSGQLAISYQSEDHVLDAGDSVYFDASEPHAYTGRSDELTRAIVITSQPRL